MLMRPVITPTDALPVEAVAGTARLVNRASEIMLLAAQSAGEVSDARRRAALRRTLMTLRALLGASQTDIDHLLALIEAQEKLENARPEHANTAEVSA